MNNLVSVIIPVFNVEKYLGSCISSVINQTYDNLEIILVNDGSTDKSGDLCDKLIQTDPRIKVIHKKNGGLSDARNVGIDVALGDYVTFVDGDDYIHHRMLEILVELVQRRDVEIATVSYRSVDEDASPELDSTVSLSEDDYMILSRADALETMLYQIHTTNSACIKIYRRIFFDENIRFPVGKLCEDLGTTYRVFAKASKVAICRKKLYFYVQRKNSIMRSDFNPRRMDGLEFAIEQNTFVERNFPAISKASRNRLFAEAVYIALAITRTGVRRHKGHWDECSSMMRKHSYEVALDAKSKKIFRIYALTALISPKLVLVVPSVIQFFQSFKESSLRR